MWDSTHFTPQPLPTASCLRSMISSLTRGAFPTAGCSTPTAADIARGTTWAVTIETWAYQDQGIYVTSHHHHYYMCVFSTPLRWSNTFTVIQGHSNTAIYILNKYLCMSMATLKPVMRHGHIVCSTFLGAANMESPSVTVTVNNEHCVSKQRLCWEVFVSASASAMSTHNNS